MSETLAIVASLDQNWGSKFFHLYTMPGTWQTKFWEISASSLVGSLICLGIQIFSGQFFKFTIRFLVGTPLTARFFGFSLFVWKA